MGCNHVQHQRDALHITRTQGGDETCLQEAIFRIAVLNRRDNKLIVAVAQRPVALDELLAPHFALVQHLDADVTK